MRCALHYDIVECDTMDGDGDGECDDGCNAMVPRLFCIEEVSLRTTLFTPSYEL